MGGGFGSQQQFGGAHDQPAGMGYRVVSQEKREQHAEAHQRGTPQHRENHINNRPPPAGDQQRRLPAVATRRPPGRSQQQRRHRPGPRRPHRHAGPLTRQREQAIPTERVDHRRKKQRGDDHARPPTVPALPAQSCHHHGTDQPEQRSHRLIRPRPVPRCAATAIGENPMVTPLPLRAARAKPGPVRDRRSPRPRWSLSRPDRSMPSVG
jgi:hypothetical protein